jgi:quercetin dioxygenase-like cupin family protein
MSPVDVPKVQKEWSRRNFQGGVFVDPPGQTWEDYVHDTDEVVMVLEGEVEFEIAGRVVRPPPGLELLIPARTLHSVRNRGNTVSRWLYAYRQGP